MYIYFVLALAGSIYLMWDVFIPVMREIQYDIPTPLVVEYKAITYFCFFCSSMLFAPFLLLSAFLQHKTFTRALANSLRKND